MRRHTGPALGLVACVAAGAAIAGEGSRLEAANDRLLTQIQKAQHLSDAQMKRLREIFEESGILGQGNPAISLHPLTPAQCRARVKATVASYSNPADEAICGAPNMVPLYDPATQKRSDAKVCIDKFEFPDIACTYPVVWVKAREAAEICSAVGKRLCDAHEWEGACAGSLQPPDYRFDLARGLGPEDALRRMRYAHNRKYAARKTWSYGPRYRKGICATASHKTKGCNGGSWRGCGSNTYPTGSFPKCRSSLGVYDLNGNVAEHMNLPLKPDQMASRGSKTLGYTEMKGSWFIFDSFRAHPDWCRWRAPFWHGTRVMSTRSHANYHLGFRCCKSLD